MSHSFDPASASPYYRFVWVDLTANAQASLAESLDGAFDIHRVDEPARVADTSGAAHPPSCASNSTSRTRRASTHSPACVATIRRCPCS